MQSQGSTSSQPSFDSLSSSNSLLFSDSEPAEDDADIFLRERSAAGGVAREDAPPGSESPGSPGWAFGGFAHRGEVGEGESERSDSARGRPGGEEGGEERGKTEGDLLFAQKCAELQGFVRPLLTLLHGLKTGRFDHGLSSFQQNVAMDRIQRIVGALQRQNGGEKHLNVLLQVEMMLKQWFPQVSSVAPQAPPPSPPPAPPERSAPGTASCAARHKQRDQLHIPVKKRRLSWTGLDTPPTLLKRLLHSEEEGWGRQQGEEGESPPPPAAEGVFQRAGAGRREESGEGGASSFKAGGWSEPALTSALPWAMLVHVAPILSTAKSGEEKRLPLAVPPPASRGNPATQDSSVSSTTPSSAPRNQQQRTGCQSQPVARQQTETKALESRQDTSSRAGPAPPP